MIYYKKKSLIKKILNKVRRDEKEKKTSFVLFFKSFFFLILFLFIGLYFSYLYLIPKYLDEASIEKAINNFVLKNSKLALDIKGFKIKPNYKFEINLKADEIKLKNPNGDNFVVVSNANIDINLFSLFYKYIDLDKIKTSKIAINTKFGKDKKYDCFKYLNFDEKNAPKFKIRKIKLENDEFLLKIYDENIKKDFKINAKNLKVDSFDFKKPILITTKGIVASSNHKISDYSLKLSIKTNQNSINSFRKKLENLNYNPFYYADFYKFYAKTQIDLKYNPADKKTTISGFVNLLDYTFEFSGLKLPQNNLSLSFKNDKIYTNCDFKFIKNQQIQINSIASLNKNKFIEAKLHSNELNLAQLKDGFDVIAKILNFKFNLDDINLEGFAKLNLYLKSNFKTIASNGNLLIQNGKIFHKKTGLTLNSIESNINFENNSINILKTNALVNEAKFTLAGKIDNKLNLNLKINSDLINIAQVLTLFQELPFLNSFVPKLNEYEFKNGFVKINADVLGNFEKPIIKSNSVLTNLKIYAKKINLNFEIPKFEMKLLENNIILPKTQVVIDSIPFFVDGIIKNYKTKQIETELKINSQLDNIDFLINNKKPNLSVILNIKQNKAQIVSCKISDSILISGEISDISKEPVLNLKANLNNKTNFKYQNIMFATLGDGVIFGNVKNINAQARLNLYGINLDNSNLKVSDGFLNIKNNKLFFQFPSVTFEDVVLEEVSFEGEIDKNDLKISNLNAKTLNGEINANADIDLKTKNLKSKVELNDLNIRLLPSKLKELFLATSGKLSANADLGLNLNQANMLDNLKADIEFSAINGELSQFAKLERFLQAGNILSQSILKLSLNSALSAITKQNTGDFKEINGKINIKNSFANILYINSQGSNMSFNLCGDVNLINKKADLKVLGRIPNQIVNVMGNFGKFSFSSQVEKSGGEVSKTMLEKRLSTQISQDDFIKIPPLAYYDSNIQTREFVVLINGLIDNLNSIQDFKWVIKE